MNKHAMVILLRRLAILLALIGIAISVVLLLNFTADNPTGRRYSSDEVDPDAAQPFKGPEGERILARDLGLTNNNSAGQQRCICDNDQAVVPSNCATCMLWADLPGQGGYVRPDFAGKGFIADSKNTKALRWSSRDQSELALYAEAAAEANIKLWVFVTVETDVDSRYLELIEGTGGGIVYYFAVPGYVDPTDRIAWIGLVSCTSLGSVAIVLELRNRKRTPSIRVQSRLRPEPLTPIDEAVAFRDRLKERAQRRLDEEESRRKL